MRIAYFDCFSGASGDMILGALLDAGLGIERLRTELQKLKLSHFRLDVRHVSKMGIGGSQVLIHIDHGHHGHHHRRLADIQGILERSDLGDGLKQKGLAVFKRLAAAEAKVHREPVEAIHFHEVGAMDAIIDVVGALSGLDALEIDEVHCSALRLGSGTVECGHGLLPVPAPATAELVKGTPAYAGDVAGELLTPTGAAILTTVASRFGPMPAMTVERIGYGAGTAELGIPNLLRVMIGAGAARNEGHSGVQPQEHGHRA